MIMQITGIGTDIAEISRIAAALARGGDDFRAMVFTSGELERAKSFRHPETYLAGCWAAKEALAKALGCGIGERCRFTEVDVELLSSAITLSGAAQETFALSGGSKIHFAGASERRYAVATVVITG